MTRKLISLILAIIIMITPCMSFFAQGNDEEKYFTSEPIILISGFMCSPLYKNYGEENCVKVWGPDKSIIKSVLKENALKIPGALFSLFTEKKEKFYALSDTLLSAFFSPLECDNIGEPIEELEHYKNSPASSNIKYMLEEDGGKYLYEVPFCTYLNKIANGDNIFCFQYDSRLDAVKIAQELKEFIDEVLEYTGKSKAKIFALSYGGLITTTYLSLYKDENKVSKAVLSVPALGGTDLPERIFTGNVNANIGNATRFLETASRSGTRAASYLKNSDAQSLNRIVGNLCKKLSGTIKYWGSIWCLMTNESYYALRDELLNKEEDAAFIENLDYIHDNIMGNMHSLLNGFKKDGIDISIIAGYGTSLALGGTLNGDIVLPVSGVTGARSADIGESLDLDESSLGSRFSPDMTVDASTCYLPDNTFFVYGHFHGQYYYEDYTRTLVTKLLFTEEIENVSSSPSFPQFAYSNNKYIGLNLALKANYLRNDAKEIALCNVTEKYKIKVLKIKSDSGAEFRALSSGIIKSGEEGKIELKKGFDKGEERVCHFKIYYIKLSLLHPFCSCEFDIMVK